MRLRRLGARRRARRERAAVLAAAQQRARPAPTDAITILKPARVFDGDTMHEGWAVRVKGERIDAVGPDAERRRGRREGDRSARHDADAGTGRRALAHPAARLQRDVVDRSGLEGRARAARGARDQPSARDADGRLHHGPRSRHRRRAATPTSSCATRCGRASFPARASWRRPRAIVATGSYQPKFVPEWSVPQGAEEADGVDSLMRVVRDQIGRGADWIKLYGDYRWGPLPGSHPTFTLGRDEAGGRDRRERRRAGRGAHEHARRACGARRWPTSRRSSTATRARRRSSS